MVISYKTKKPEVVNYLKAMYFDKPDWVPCQVAMTPATWLKYGKELAELQAAHPALFPHADPRAYRGPPKMPNPLYETGRFTDTWGTVWKNIEEGLEGMTIAHPLDDWDAFADYKPPIPLQQSMFGPRNWNVVQQQLAQARNSGEIAVGGGLHHGYMFMRLWYLRGFENLMMDIATEDPRLLQLIKMVENYNTTVINRYVELGAEMIKLGDDLGFQHALPMSPEAWRRLIKPAYSRMYARCREEGIPIRQHTDGCILEIIPDLIEVGVTLLNPQFRSNGLDGLKRVAKGKVALHQDLDRQLFPFASPSEIEEHVGSVVEELNTPKGGLMLRAECAPDLSLDTIDAICVAVEKVCKPPRLTCA